MIRLYFVLQHELISNTNGHFKHIHTHKHTIKNIWKLIYVQTNLTHLCWFSDNYAQVPAIKQVNVNLSEAFI